MEGNTKMLETLIERATEYGKSSFELVKLKTLDKTSDALSSFIPLFIVMVLIASFLVFFNLGIAFWLGQIIGNTFIGFFAVAGFYVIMATITYFFLRKWLKKCIGNYFIQQMLK